MDTTDISALTQRIQELEEENARLKAILDKNGIEYASFESKACGTSHVGTTAVSTCQFTLQEKVPYFKACSKVVMMFLPSVGTVMLPKSLAISQYARENGIVSFATSENTGVRIVPTDNSLL